MTNTTLPAWEDFEREMVVRARQSIMKAFASESFVMPDYANRVKIPAELVQRVYSLVDRDEVIRLLAPKINELIANRIAARIATELAGDVKRVLADKAIRDQLRETVRQVIEGKKS